ncbi:MAG: hypothetical protein KF715_09275 [Candidatus Didemnitutus sp.]|nr:hypothetical protein [Candidatus Didemnitutus sp.]
MSEPLWQPRSDRAARLLGLGFFAGGAGLLWQQASGILSAVAERRDVSYFHAAIALGVLGLVLGVFWMVRGLAGYTAVRTLQKNRRALRWFGVAAAVVLGGVFVALHAWLQSLGYAD